MRKVSMLILALISVLSVWGQNETVFEYESVKQIATKLKMQQSIVVERANASKISNVDKANADSILTKTFASLDNVLGIYNDIKEDSALEYEAQTIIIEFLNAYQKAILSDDKSSIQISTRNFLRAAENSMPKLDAFYNKAQEYINQHSEEKEKDAIEQLNYEESSTSTNTEIDNDSVNENSTISIWDWIAIGLGIIGILIGGYGIFNVNKAHTRITTRRNEIKDLESRLMQRINEIKPSSYRGPSSSSYTPQSQYVPKPPVKRREPIVVSQQKHEDPKPQQPIVEQKPTISNLFATIKAGSPLAEFFKVSSENSGDKVFMLTLSYPEAEVADFTIVPNMAPDFMKSVIVDRDTYLPALFCEKSIDSQNPSRIEVLSQGRAKKVEGKWQVQERMSIRLV